MTRRAETLTAEYLPRHVPEEPLPRFLNSPPIQDGPEHTTPLQTVAGFVLLAFVAVIFGVML